MKVKKIKISREDMRMLSYSLAEVWKLDIRRLAKHLFKQEYYKLYEFELITDNNEIIHYCMHKNKKVLTVLGMGEGNKIWHVEFFRTMFLEEKDQNTLVMKNDANKSNSEIADFVRAFFLINIWLETTPKLFKKKKGVYTFEWEK